MTLAKQDKSARVEALANTRLSDCYQCGKCTAGCPRGDVMDMPPTRVMRAAQIGAIDQAAGSLAVWQCLSCLTCTARCPKSVEVAGVMDAMRQIGVEDNLTNPAAVKVVEFQKAFLRNVRRNGRTNETEMATDFEARYFFRRFDVVNALKTGMLAPKMLARKKLEFKLGSPVKDKALVKRIFDKCDVKL
ncbi:MAG: 4Fe-4S dicluster domain-containing protein [Planctomycetia bacterium]|nr:4Fe-4S dicluster domain-containing protein [Planctomycetia bacterium]